jgi:hypothetical protein
MLLMPVGKVGVDDELSDCATIELLDRTIGKDGVAEVTMLLPMDDAVS